jgi:two-component SAPR family response regulator
MVWVTGVKRLKVIAVDDKEINLEIFEFETEDIRDVELVGMFQKPQDALDYAKENTVDVAVLDIEMPQMSGIELGKSLRQLCPAVSLIYITGYKKYAYDAFQVDACSYLTKPFKREDIAKALSRAALLHKSREEEEKESKQSVFIRTFGKFDVFLNDKPLDFSSEKAKELLAFLVDRKGGIVSTEEMITYLWEDRPDDDKSRNLCRKVVQRLHKQLEEWGIGDIVIRHNRGRSLDVSKVDCDYYEYLNGNQEGKNEFSGVYMANYSWGEETLAALLSK